jgi:diguanylate cyclase (GGDEF)-like protein/PAS domain S-box-containing protein
LSQNVSKRGNSVAASADVPVEGDLTQLLITMLGSVSQGIFMVGEDGRVVAFNPRVCELLDLPPSFLSTCPTLPEITRLQLDRGDFGDQATLVDSNARDYVASAGNRPFPAKYLRATPQGRTIEVKTQPLPAGGLVRTFTDVTDYVQTQNELKRSSQLLKATQSMAAVGGWEVDAQTGAMFWTDEVYRMLEISPSEFSPNQDNVWRFFPPETVSDMKVVMAQMLANGNGHDIEIPMVTARGRRIWVHSKNTPPTGQSGGLPCMAVLRDITAQHEAQEALRASEALLRRVTSQVPGVVYRLHISPQGRRSYSFVSDGVRTVFALEPEEVLADGDLLPSLMHPDDRAMIQAHFDRTMANDEQVAVEYRVRLRDGTVKWVQMTSIVESRNEDGVTRNGVLVDITAHKQSKAALAENEALFREVASQIPGMVYRVRITPEGKRAYSFVSPGVKALYGVEVADVLADGSCLHRFRHPDDKARMEQEIKTVVRDGLLLSTEFRIMLDDGTQKWIQMSSSVIEKDELGAVRIGVLLDITERKAAEAALRDRDELWKLALESTGDGVWDWYIQTGVELYSRRILEMYGFAKGELTDEAAELDRRTHPDDVAQMLRDRQAHFDGLTPAYVNEHRIQCKDGSWKWIMSRGMVISRDSQGRPTRMTGTHTDITDRKQAEALIWQQANFDTLTGLPNRRMLRDRLEQSLMKCRQHHQRLALLFIDLDHFKEVNDTLGHHQGDVLLVEAASRIRGCLREIDTVARMGGDEFTVVLSALPGLTGVEQVVQQIITAISEPFQLGRDRAFVSASVGVTFFPDDATDIDGLLKHADQALYAAKGAGRNRFSYFTPALQTAAQNRASLALDLRSALLLGQFWVAYQPIVELKTGLIHKAEALLRWQHPVRGVVGPGEFIPIAESSGVILEIGDWVFREAAKQVAQWRERMHPRFQISVNKSPVQFHNEERLHLSWFELLRSMGLPGESMVVEITEGLLLDANPSVNAQLLAMRDAGVGVSLDDFGTGYSSLSYLQQYHIDYLKIDQSFVRRLSPISKDLALCKAIISMAHELGMKVVAEGVETSSQRDLLTAAGCDFGQGYLFAKPMAAHDFETAWAKEHGGFLP